MCSISFSGLYLLYRTARSENMPLCALSKPRPFDLKERVEVIAEGKKVLLLRGKKGRWEKSIDAWKKVRRWCLMQFSCDQARCQTHGV